MTVSRSNRIIIILAGLAVAGCEASGKSSQGRSPLRPTATPPTQPNEQKLSHAAYNPAASPIVLKNATILTAAGKVLERGTVVLTHGSIIAVSPTSPKELPANAKVIDATGRFITPGLIDAHSHIGVYARPSDPAHADGNEMTDPITAQVQAVSSYWSGDPAIDRALAGGVTTALVLPGSGNIIGGRGFTVTMRRAPSAYQVAFPGAPTTLKMACGENPKRIHKGRFMSRMGEYAAFRAIYRKAAEYGDSLEKHQKAHAKWRKQYQAGKAKKHGAPTPPSHDAKLDTLYRVLAGEALVQVHCYRSSDIAEMLAIADEFGFKIRAFHHALEAYKVRDQIIAHGAGIATWADWWGFKLEAYDGIMENAALFTESGGRAVIHSDSAIGIQRLNQEAAKALRAGRAAGIKLSDNDALRWITANPAWLLGIDSVTGTLEVGKRADVVVWSAHPLSVYARADVVVQAGELVYERGKATPSDFELGHPPVDGSANEQGGQQ